MRFAFSFLYLSKYRTIDKVSVSFDHRFEYDAAKRILARKDEDGGRLEGPHFYGAKVYSMSCLVGRNGEGKTGIIDFLRDGFVLLLEAAAGGTKPMEGGKILLSEKDMRYYHLDENTEFLVVFRADGKDRILTNIKDVAVRNSEPMYIPGPEAADLYYRVAYFSAMRFPDGVAKEELFRNRRERAYVERILGKHNIDLSEERFNEMRNTEWGDARNDEGGTGVLNWDLVMQLALLHRWDNGKKEAFGVILDEVLGKNRSEPIAVCSSSLPGGEEILPESSLKGVDLNRLENALLDPMAYMRPFSSGQYSRFSFLARLAFCLDGGESFFESAAGRELCRRLEIEGSLGRMFAYDPSETPVLLMDESDLFYHPEWQRGYVKDILETVNAFAKENVQIIFTTNSAFMLSDMLKEDVVVLSRDAYNYGLDDRTFGQNIHMLLARPFFMKSTIGAAAEETIRWLLGLLAPESKKNIPEEVRSRYSDRLLAYKQEAGKELSADEFVKRLIDSIGEELIRHRLIFLYEEYMKKRRSENDNLKNALDYLEPMKEENENIKKAIEEIKKAKGVT